jgi:hypothetical protein
MIALPNFSVPLAELPFALRAFELLRKLESHGIHSVTLSDLQNPELGTLVAQLEEICYTIDMCKDQIKN